ncbi:MAG: 50S ribosomal protein L13 [archaeon]
MRRLIDATNLKAGRLASSVAKSALNGDTIVIVNSEKAVITGNQATTKRDYLEKQDIGSRYQGPFAPKKADRILKRTIRGMLPYKKTSGANAFKRITTYLGVPLEFENAKFETVEGAKIIGVEKRKYITLEKLSHRVGGKPMQTLSVAPAVAKKSRVKEGKAERAKE